MKQLQSAEELKSWDSYRTYMKESLKLVDGEAPAYISKLKLEFQIDGKPWKGHAFLAGKKAKLSIQKFKKDGVIFREGTCVRSGKDLELSGFALPMLIKECQKTFLKLKLGYKISGSDAEADQEAGGTGDEAAWKKLKAALGSKIKPAIEGGSQNKDRIVELVRQATGDEKAGDYAAATAAFEEIRGLLEQGGSELSPERRSEMVKDLTQMEKDIDRLMSALK